MVDVEIKLSPALHILRSAQSEAACPLEVAIAAAPPSRAAILSSTAITVGFSNLE